MSRFPMIYAATALALMSACAEAKSGGALIANLEKLAAANDAEAIYHLGMAYHTGSGVAEDPARALAAFRRSAALGDPLGAYKLGCYYDGQGGELVERDPAVALRFKLVAAQAGYALAQQDVASLYAAQGSIPNALEWIEKAAAQGWADALLTYASIHNGAPGIARDPAKTAAYFRLFLDRAEASDKQRKWLREFEKGLNADDRARAAALVRAYRPQPTELTLKALSGQQAAQELADRKL